MTRPFDHDRPGSRARGYNTRWENASARFKASNPWCTGCEAIGLQRPTEVVDHIIPHRGNNTLFWNQNNWQACCAWHHNAVKPILERMWRNGRISSADLVLSNSLAKKISSERHRPTIGADGFPIPGT